MEVEKMTPKGEVTKRVSHMGNTSQAWIRLDVDRLAR